MKVLNAIMEMIESGRALDQFSEPLAKGVRSLTEPRLVKNALSGSWLGHQLHPMLTDIPIGAWSMATALDLTGGQDSAAAAKRLVGLGALAAVPTALSGASDWSEEHGPPQRVGLVHAAANSIGLTLQLASWAARAKGHRKTGVLLSFAGLSSVGVGGYLGGHLSYVQGVGVNHTAFESPDEQWCDIAAVDEVEEDTALRADADGVAVMVVKDDGAICVLSATCTHAGGPLDEGEIEDHCVRCPWHGSTFSLTDGSVVRGPASVDQPTWDVKVENGRVLARQG
ncbi:Rieske 2Fe-2S domain-containing protein [Brevibacterium renqingii]|uniref:Rieske 2Fe-2S domain-containing protein n=1 Tax=Brevibacterium renqingii TaxID=2776916 RepID=UPI0020A35A34|nr:Rieske 2Fe-2S domain-containing protein [Brevibacterium renqingii]